MFLFLPALFHAFSFLLYVLRCVGCGGGGGGWVQECVVLDDGSVPSVGRSVVLAADTVFAFSPF